MNLGRLKESFSQIKKESAFMRHYFWKYRKMMGMGLAVLVIVDALEIIPAYLLKLAIDNLVAGGEASKYLHLALAYLGVAFIQALCRYGWRVTLVRMGILSGKDIRSEYIQRLLKLPVGFFERKKIGELISLATNDVEAMRHAISGGLIVFADAIFYLMTVPIAMYLLSPSLTMLSFLALPLIPWVVIRYERQIHVRFEKVQETFAELASMAQESLMGIRVIKAFAVENIQAKRFQKLGEKYIHWNRKLSIIQSSFGPILDLFMSLGMVALFFVGGAEVIAGAVTVGTFVAFQKYVQKMIWPMEALGLSVTFYQRGVTSFLRMSEVLSSPVEVRRETAPSRGAIRSIEIKNLNFAYETGANQKSGLVLNNINLSIKEGERVAIVGGVGSGKTTLISLLAGLYPTERGQIFLNEIDICDWSLLELREQISFVSQEVFLFSGSIDSNLKFGLKRQEAPPVPSEELIRTVGLSGEVRHFAQGLQTMVGERGLQISGGQKQRVALGRALMKPSSLLILDDVLSAVDVETAQRILDNLKNQKRRGIELVVSHRVSTVKGADRVIVLDGGHIVEEGKHEVLMQSSTSLYRKLFQHQENEAKLEKYMHEVFS